MADDSTGPFGHKYNPSQPRVPAGNSDGGQWSDGDGGGGRTQVANPLRRLLRRRPAQQPKQPAQPPASVPIPPGKAIRNKGLAGRKHPDTGVPFDKDGFPDFSGVAKKTVQVPHTGKRASDFQAANKAAAYDRTPDGMTWHHHQDGRTMQLVPKVIHDRTGHTGSIGIQKLPGKKYWETKSMEIPMRRFNPPTTELQVMEFERQHGLELPRSFREFLLEANGGVPENSAVMVETSEGLNAENVQEFLGLDLDGLETSELSYPLGLYKGGIPDFILPIAHEDTGNYFCLDLRQGQERVVFWDKGHFWGTGEWREQDLYPVAGSFEEFLLALKSAG